MSRETRAEVLKSCSKAALLAAIVLAGAAGCETATTHKTNLDLHVADVTTTPPASAHADPPGTQPQHQAPVPGSPTASNADGTQPPDDTQAPNSMERSPSTAEAAKATVK